MLKFSIFLALGLVINTWTVSQAIYSEQFLNIGRSWIVEDKKMHQQRSRTIQGRMQEKRGKVGF